MQTETLPHQRNNLGKSSSPYLLQHADNPVWWQEWNENTVRQAAEEDMPVFVSIGYSTCHWCHVMAEDAFSDRDTSDFLNTHFICIKVDREQRPDIDQIMMEFIKTQNGSGGWPLNVFLTSSLRPVFALTYAPAKDNNSHYSLISTAEKVHKHIKKYGNRIPPFRPVENVPPVAGESSIVRTLSDMYDSENGGFGSTHKFPPHSTLLYLLYQLGVGDSPSVRTMCTKTLDSMMLGGLNDHLQGGIFRYCVDNEWTIPHFEKMLYDQALALWSYSLAYHITAIEDYRFMAEKIVRCLDESFYESGFYISAYDADTQHREGATYLWSYDELTEALTDAEFRLFNDTYYTDRNGNFDGLNHLVRKNRRRIDQIEEKLLQIRKSRRQPSPDRKIISSLNALTAIALIHAGRYIEMPAAEEKGILLVRKLLGTFWNGSSLVHSIFNGNIQEQSFLSDAAALLAAITFISESDSSWNGTMDEIACYLESFRKDGMWIESESRDFQAVYASWFDHPIPSGASMAEMALARYQLLKGRDPVPVEYHQPFHSDFYNINAMIHNGLFHVFTSLDLLKWDKLPVNSIQLRGEHEQDCFMGVCKPLADYGTW